MEMRANLVISITSNKIETFYHYLFPDSFRKQAEVFRKDNGTPYIIVKNTLLQLSVAESVRGNLWLFTLSIKYNDLSGHIQTRGSRIQKFKDPEPLRIQQEEIRIRHLFNFKIRIRQ